MATTTITEIEVMSQPRSAHSWDKHKAGLQIILSDFSETGCEPGQSTLGHGTTNRQADGLVSGDYEEGINNSTEAIPDGGYGWVIVLSCAILNFFSTAFPASWGVLQTALLESQLSNVPTSTVAWIGSLSLCICVSFGLGAVRILPVLGARNLSLLGVFLLSLGIFTSGFTTHSVGGLFVAYGILVGFGTCIIYMIINTLPTHYFNGSLGGKLGLANGIIKLGGGIGAAVMSVALEALNRKVGIAWTFRISGIITLAVGLPAAWYVRERITIQKAPLVDPSMFKSTPFLANSLAGAVAVFGLNIPGFYLPMFAQSIGLASSTGAAIVSGFNVSGAIGRFIAGPACDWLGAFNVLLITMVLGTVSTLAIWPTSSSIGPLVIFAVINGISNGGFFTTMPTVTATMVGPGRAAVGMSMTTTGWTFGYLLGPPIAGYLLPRSFESQPVESYRPTIFYAGGISLLSCALVVWARLTTSKKLIKKV
jgi:MFS transporter, MCT family, solute carrier family 16 (monocarboxylic acid transporters), member 3